MRTKFRDSMIVPTLFRRISSSGGGQCPSVRHTWERLGTKSFQKSPLMLAQVGPVDLIQPILDDVSRICTHHSGWGASSISPQSGPLIHRDSALSRQGVSDGLQAIGETIF